MPTNLLARRRSPIARLAVIALIAGLLVIPAVPAGAATAACPSTIPSAGFTDLTGLPQEAIDSINCIKFYGITTGTTATTFAPNDPTKRWEMALFITRTATDMGITLSSGASGPFTDLAGVPASAVTAINQIKDLGITTGLTATTFGPFNDTLRYEMALFLKRLLVKDGVILNASPPSAGFTDISTLSAEAQLAINQLAEKGIAKGTTATTFDPFGNVARWQMALFLARSLNVAGVLPPANITVTPSDAATLNLTAGGSVTRAYTVTVQGATSVTIELWTSSQITSDNKFKAAASAAVAADTWIDVVNGVSVTATTKVTSVNVSGGSATFTVKADAVAAGVRPVVYTGTAVEGIGAATATTPLAATNLGIGFGGSLVVVQEGAGGGFSGAIASVDKVGNSFVIGSLTYFYDDNDIFKISGVPKLAADWEAELSTGDDILAGSVYGTEPALQSTFDLLDDSPVAPAVVLVSTTSSSAKFTYTADAAASTVRIYRCLGSGCTTSLVGEVSATSDADTALAGLQIVATGLAASTDYDFQFSQVVDGEESAKGLAIDVDTTAAPTAVAITAIVVQDVNDGLGVWTQIDVTFDKAVTAVAAPSSVTINPTSQPLLKFAASAGVVQADPKVVRFTFATQNDSTPDTAWTLTVGEGALDMDAALGVQANASVTGTFSH